MGGLIPGSLVGRLHGLWALGALSSLLVPATVEVCAFHRGHWSGVDAPAFWGSVVVPAAAATWAVVSALALGGWVSSAAPEHPRRLARAGSGALLGLAGGVACALAALPGWIWLWRLGVVSAEALGGAYGLPALGLMLAGAGAGAAGPLVGGVGAVALGAALGALAPWLTLGA